MDSVPGMYAFAWIDQLSTFHEKGKITLIKVLTSHKKFIDVSENPSETEIIALTINAIEEFICHMYGYKKSKDILEVLVLNFEK